MKLSEIPTGYDHHDIYYSGKGTCLIAKVTFEVDRVDENCFRLISQHIGGYQLFYSVVCLLSDI